MKRSEPPRRKTPLRRTPLRARRRKVSDPRRDPIADAFHDLVIRRARGRCEARYADGCTGRAAEAHHVVTRGRGQGWPWLNDPARNGLACCTACHEQIHRPHPATPDDLLPKRLGLLRSRPITNDDPGPVLDGIRYR